MKEYVRLTYLPAGTTRKRTCWAVVLKRSATRVTYNECTEEGDTTTAAGFKDGVPVERRHLIVATPEEVRERPARMNPKYALLEIVPV